MTTIILTIIGILIAAAAAIMMIFYGGDAFNSGSDEAEAVTFINESVQIESAVDLYVAEKGSKPGNEDGTGAIEELENARYLKDFPRREGGGPSEWKVDYATGYARTPIGSADDERAQRICAKIRDRHGLDGEPKRCDDETLSVKDPCCIDAG